MNKVFNAKSYKKSMCFFQRQGNRIIEKRISHNEFPWYFCVRYVDFCKHKTLFKDLQYREHVISYKRDHNPDFVRVYCENRNIWKDSPEEDARRIILAELRQLRIKTYEDDLRPHERYMLDKNVPIEDNHYVGYFDIETKDVSKTIEIGAEPIISIACMDAEGNKWCWVDSNEEALLRAALSQLKKFTLLYGWYSKGFDWDYIKARCSKYHIRFPLWHVNHVDMMEWFKKAAMAGHFKGKKVTKYSLEFISQMFLGEGKTEGVKAGGGRLWKLFHDDPDKLAEYNLNDVILLQKLDKELHITPQLTKTSCICGAFVGYASNTNLTDKYLLKLAHENNRRLIGRKLNRQKPKVAPPGGRVFIKKPGVYENVEVFDFSSMYSTLMRSLNIGPDTIMSVKDIMELPEEHRKRIPLIISPYTHLQCEFMQDLRKVLVEDGRDVSYELFKVKGREDIRLTILRVEGITGKDLDPYFDQLWKKWAKVYTISRDCFKEYFFKIKRLKSSIKITPPMPVYIRNDFKSIVSMALEEYTNNRNIAKGWKKDLIAKGHDSKTAAMVHVVAEINAWKLLGNALYGQSGFAMSRIFHLAFMPSITLFGQFCNNLTGDWFENLGGSVKYKDTDSDFVTLADSSDIGRAVMMDKFENTYHPWLHAKLKDTFNCTEVSVNLEWEKKYARLALFAKKRYAGHIVLDADKGVVDKDDRKGLEIVRRETVEYAVKFQGKILDHILKRKAVPTGPQMFKFIQTVKANFEKIRFNNDNVHLIAKRVCVSKAPAEYKNRVCHVRIIERMMARGDPFVLGSVLEYVITQRVNPMKKEGEEIGFYCKNPDDFKLDYVEYWDKEIYGKMFKILRCVYPHQRWWSLFTENARISNKRYRQLQKRINAKKERTKTLGMIESYVKFDTPQRLDILKEWMDKEKTLDPIEGNIEQAIALKKSILSGEYYEEEE